MRKLFPMMAVAVVFSCVSLMALAAAEKTITGKTECAKCTLSETKKCQNVVVVDEGGKEVKYYMDMKNAVAKKNHPAFCKGGKKVKATGDVEEKDGKLVMTPTTIEVIEE